MGAKFHYEFGGPIGAFFIIWGLPAVIYGLYFLCNKEFCLRFDTSPNWELFYSTLTSNTKNLFTDEGTSIFIGWMIFHFFLERILPGETAFGVLLPNNERLPYVLSGHLQFWVTLAVIWHGIPEIVYISNGPGNFLPAIENFKSLPLYLVYDHYVGLITSSILFSLALAIYLYATSFKNGAILAKGGNSGNPIYDFFIGRELNPRVGNFDLKVFCELRPGLIGWMVINMGMAYKQYQNDGVISLSMLFLNIFQGFYVWDALSAERAILTTMDVTTDGFGFMLAFGDLAWVPFIYSLQSRYLVDYDPHLSINTLLLVVGLQLLGYYIFRAANSEKDAFRRDPSSPEVAHLTYLQTKRGTKLITSGWWGMARKINYTGDWLMTLSWCLLCGFDSPIPYFQAVYFLILLIHRALRDDHMCHEKYGDDWLEYKKKVPYLFIPYII
mmetsp:Transcript_20735/g.21388  ORF Transcript_20735/g.21388 Transcript_20735/m.21388 type:complete len:441 (+) Transcript_20735:12-1334(+)